MTKICTGCKEEKDLEEFHKQKGGKLGRYSRCKVCVKDYDALRHSSNKDEINERIRVSRLPGGTQYESYVARTNRNNEAKRASPDYAEINKRNNLRRYNITLEQYNQMREDQNYTCAICPKHESELTRGLQVDHDHNCCPGSGSCGKCIRGLLCHGCNTTLGAVGDSTTILLAMINYLSSY